MLVPLVLVVIAGTIVAGAVVWAWRHGSLRTSEQERYDMEFERMVRRLDSSAS